MKYKKLSIIAVVVLVLSLFLVTGFTPKRLTTHTVYHVYLKGESLGIIKSKQSLEEYINKKQSEVKKKYNVDKIKINCTTTTAFYNVNDRITFYVQLLDINNNPVPNKEISVYIDNNDSNDFGTIEYYKNNISDNNGIVPVTYYPNGDFINDSIVTINIKCNSIEEHLSIKVKKRVI